MSRPGVVLLVEDEQNMRRVLAALLERDGHEVIQAANGVIALEHLARRDVDAVLTTREVARLIKMRGLDLNTLKPDVTDTPFGERSSAGKLPSRAICSGKRIFMDLATSSISEDWGRGRAGRLRRGEGHGSGL